MTGDDIEQIKTELASLYKREAATRRTMFRPYSGPVLAPSELAELESLLASDPEVARLGEIVERGLDARRKALLARRDQPPARQDETPTVAKAAFTAATNARRTAAEFLKESYSETILLLDTPFLIWPSAALDDLDIPNAPAMDLAIWRDSNIEKAASWLKIYIDATRTPVPQGYVPPSDSVQHGDGGNRQADFRFYFLWQNPNKTPVVLNASSSLFFFGYYDARASTGVFSGNYANLQVLAYLNVIRWSGWGNGRDQTPYPIYDTAANNKWVIDDQVYGGSNFGHAFGHFEPYLAGEIDPQSYTMSADMIYVPGRAVTMFEVGFTVDWWLHNDSGESVDNDGQRILLDLARDDHGRFVQCPWVELEILDRHPIRSH